MTIQPITEALHTAPFRPFRIHLADGRSFHVPHTDHVAISQTGKTLIVYGEGDSFNVVDVLMITGIEVLAK